MTPGRSGWCAAVMGLALAGSAQATPLRCASSGDPSLSAAIRAYQNLQLDEASAQLARAATHRRSRTVEACLDIYRGLVSLQRNHTTEARQDFHRALRAVPDAAFPEADVPPSVRKLWDEARAQVRAAPPPRAHAAARPLAPPKKVESPPAPIVRPEPRPQAVASDFITPDVPPARPEPRPELTPQPETEPEVAGGLARSSNHPGARHAALATGAALGAGAVVLALLAHGSSARALGDTYALDAHNDHAVALTEARAAYAAAAAGVVALGIYAYLEAAK